MTDDDVVRMGYLPEERGLYKKMKVGEQALYLARLKGMPKAEAHKRLKERFDQWDMGGWWNKKVEELSKGMAQKVQFITTVLHGPRLLILDEPFSGFDPINADLIRGEILRLRDEGTTVMLSTHNMGSVEELCDHIALVDRSHVVINGSVREVRKRYATDTFRVDYKGTRIALADAIGFNGELIEHREEADHCTARVKLQHGATLNTLLRSLIATVEVQGVVEEVPRMHDVFIKAVKGREAAIPDDMTE